MAASHTRRRWVRAARQTDETDVDPWEGVRRRPHPAARTQPGTDPAAHQPFQLPCDKTALTGRLAGCPDLPVPAGIDRPHTRAPSADASAAAAAAGPPPRMAGALAWTAEAFQGVTTAAASAAGRGPGHASPPGSAHPGCSPDPVSGGSAPVIQPPVTRDRRAVPTPGPRWWTRHLARTDGQSGPTPAAGASRGLGTGLAQRPASATPTAPCLVRRRCLPGSVAGCLGGGAEEAAGEAVVGLLPGKATRKSPSNLYWVAVMSSTPIPPAATPMAASPASNVRLWTRCLIVCTSPPSRRVARPT